MIPALWVILAGLPLAAPPKLLINARVETVSAASGLDRVFRPLVSAQAQPAWIGYTVPLVQGYNLGCEFVSPGGGAPPGVVHLEPPDRAVILFRAEAGAVIRIRVLSPDCEIDAGGLAVHWLEDVRPADSTALLRTFATAKASGIEAKSGEEGLRAGAVAALAVSDEPGALDVLIALARTDENRRIRRRSVAALARSKDPRAVAFFNEVLKR